VRTSKGGVKGEEKKTEESRPRYVLKEGTDAASSSSGEGGSKEERKGGVFWKSRRIVAIPGIGKKE